MIGLENPNDPNDYNNTDLSKEQKLARILTILGYVIVFIVSIVLAILSNNVPVYDKCENKLNKTDKKSTKKTYIYSSIFMLVEIAALIVVFKV